MLLALRELRRRPGRFAVVAAALAVLVVLLLFLGGLLDGLYLNSTGAIRAVDADAVVFSDDARDSLARSSIDQSLRARIEGVDGVEAVGGLGISLLGVALDSGGENGSGGSGDAGGPDDAGDRDGRDRQVVDGAVAGYELASGTLPDPPRPGEAYADRSFEADGVSVGDTLAVGPAGVEVEVVGWVDDTNYLFQNGLWVEPGTWRRIQNENRPDATVGDGEFQVLVVRGGGDVAERVEAATEGVDALTEFRGRLSPSRE